MKIQGGLWRSSQASPSRRSSMAPDIPLPARITKVVSAEEAILFVAFLSDVETNHRSRYCSSCLILSAELAS